MKWMKSIVYIFIRFQPSFITLTTNGFETIAGNFLEEENLLPYPLTYQISLSYYVVCDLHFVGNVD